MKLELFVATFNGGLFGGESYFEAYPDISDYPNICESYVPDSSRNSIKNKLFDVVKEHGFLSSRKNPKKISVSVESVYIKDGKLARKFYGIYEIQPPTAKMTSIEFNEERDLLLSDVPEQFKYLFSIIALDISSNSERYEDAIMKLKDWIILFWIILFKRLHNYEGVKTVEIKTSDRFDVEW